MRLDGLIPLYRDMKDQGLNRYKFDFIFNKVHFDVFFFIDESPFKLMFGVKMKNFYFEIDLHKGFKINTYLGEKYGELCKVLGLEYDPNSSFKSSYFFQEFNQKIPSNAHRNSYPKPYEVALYRRDVEEADKIYFWGWLSHETTGKNVRPENLEKTRILLGVDAYEACKRNNISSKWTDDKRKAITVTMPE
ncbi:DUF6037 family protein [Ectobacillus panaciterrae]|uniref:DUF6037 family protein n=1 Tax=Ectobacillus panaciterrae TaxID=363872 RepID=UPI0004140161|nr:DUF6037 family protein [Ectobacillus panaciterrae]